MNKIFFAHSSKDKKIYINSIFNILENDIGRNKIVYDIFDFDTELDIEKQIKQALSKTSIFIIFLSANSIKSEWVRFELDEAIKLYRKNIKIICGINITSQNFDKYIKKIINDRVDYFLESGKDINEVVRIIKKYYKLLEKYY